MIHARLPRLPRLASLCTAGVLLLPAGCVLPLTQVSQEALTAPGAIPGEWKVRLVQPPTPPAKGNALLRTSYHAGEPVAAVLPNVVAIDLDTVRRLASERNPQILLARERVNESQIAYDAAVNSCIPEFLRKDTFKRPVAEALLWRRRAELAKTQHEVLQDAANTYFDWLTARRGEAISRDLEKYEEKLLNRAQRLASGEKTAQVLVEGVQTALNGRRQFMFKVHQQGEAAAAKLAYLLGASEPLPTPVDGALEPIDLVDVGVSVEMLVRQALENGPGVRELQGLSASIQKSIDEARFAQCVCDRTGAAIICGRLHMAQSQSQQANFALFDTQGKLRAGVEEAVSAILSGRDQITRGASAIQHAAETYRIMDLILTEGAEAARRSSSTYNAVLRSIQQLSQTHANYLSAVSAYNKAQVRLLLLIGTNSTCLH
ncbi:MAG TPA: TolC family protein [Gemmataceae bacterium]|nr:TolC family protein [Gemmataceae bacterium]